MTGCVPAIPTEIEQLFTALKKGKIFWYMDFATIQSVICYLSIVLLYEKRYKILRFGHIFS